MRTSPRELPVPDAPKKDVERVLVQEVPAPGESPELPETSFEDTRSISVARKSRPGGYLKLPLEAVRAIGKRVVLLSKAMVGTDLILRVRLFPIPAHARR